MNPIIDGIIVMEGGYTQNAKDRGGKLIGVSPKPLPVPMVIQGICET